jgi:hypothetical protein
MAPQAFISGPNSYKGLKTGSGMEFHLCSRTFAGRKKSLITNRKYKGPPKAEEKVSGAGKAGDITVNFKQETIN